MIDINLLNNKKLNDSDSHFFDIDESLLENSANLEDSSKNKKKEQKTPKAKVNKAKKSLLGLFVLSVLLIIGACFYYQFYFQYKSQISSQNIERMLYYVLDNNHVDLIEFNFRDEGIDINLEIKDNFFNAVKGDIKKHLNKIDSFRDFKLGRSELSLFISYPYFVNIVNVEYDEDREEQDYNLLNTENINKDSLKEILDKFFKINNSNLINFKISLNKANNQHFYDILFIK